MALTIADLGALDLNNPNGSRVADQVMTVLRGPFDVACLTVSVASIERARQVVLDQQPGTVTWRDAVREALLVAINVQGCLPRYRVSRTTSWVDWAGGSTDRLRNGLHQAGWDAGGIEQFLREYAAGQVGTRDATTWRDRIEGLLRIRETRVERVDTVTVDVLLFAFSAPAVKGARVVYSETRTMSQGRSWLLNFNPIGTSHAATLDVEQVVSYSASAGSCKLVLVPVAVRVEQLAILRHGEVVGRGVRAGALPPEASQDRELRRRAVQSIRALDLPSPGTPPFDVLALDVRQDRSRDLHTASRSWTIDVGREVSAAIPGIALSANVKSRQLNKLTLACDLPAGYEYHAEIFSTHLAWTRPTERTASRRRAA